MFIFNSYIEFLLTGLIIFVSQLIYSVVGFASGMVALSSLTLIFGNAHIYVPLLVMLCIPTELSVFTKDFKHIKFNHVKYILLFAIPFLFFGGWLLKKISFYSVAELSLGLIIIILAFYYMFFPNSEFRFISKDNLFIKFIFGTLSGVLGGVFGISGPPLVIYYKICNFTKAEFRATMIGCFLPMSSLRLVFYYLLGFYNIQICYSALVLYPFVIVSIFMGNIIYNKINENLFKKIVTIILFINGILLFIKSL